MRIIQAIKSFFKYILPPPVKSFMREVNNLNDSIWRSKGELERGIRSVSLQMKSLSDSSNASMNRFDTELSRLHDLFASSNRENLRLFFEAQKERAELLASYEAMNESLVNQLDMAWQENARLASCLDNARTDIAQLSSCFELLKHDSQESFRELISRIDEMFTHEKSGFQELTKLEEQLSAKCFNQHQIFQRTLNNITNSINSLSTRQLELLDPQLYAHAIKMWYQNRTGRILNLDNPVTYNEKIQWMKLYDNDPRKTMLADKVRVRNWVEDRIGAEHLLPLIAVYKRAVDIDFDELPDRFVLKANHGSGWNAIVKNKSEENLEALRWKADGWLRTNFAFVNGYEMHYCDIPRMLLVEDYVCNEDGDLPDYKFWCFSGKVHYIQYLAGRQTELKMAFFDRKWNKLPFVYDHPRYEGDIQKPSNLDEMISIAEELSKGFAHVRVDLYRLDDGSIKFGELTFSSASGVCRWDPPEIDEVMGKLVNLPLVASR